MKSKGTAYLLWFFLGLIGVHRFYLEKIGTGILYLLTFGFFGVGWFIDLFTLGGQVDTYNAIHGGARVQQNQQQSQNIVVNVAAPTAGAAPVVQISAEKQVLSLAHTNQILTTKQIVAQTTLELDEAEEVLKKLVSKGLAKELVESNGTLKYDFS